jgi:hypothetical protein
MACPSSREQAKKDMTALADARDDLAHLWHRTVPLPGRLLAWFRARRQRAMPHSRGAAERP